MGKIANRKSKSVPARRASKTPRAKAAKAKSRMAQKPAAPQGNSKLETLISLLRRKDGASLDELIKATGWQAHSVRGAISGALKKKLGLKIVSAKPDDVRLYRIVE